MNGTLVKTCRKLSTYDVVFPGNFTTIGNGNEYPKNVQVPQYESTTHFVDNGNTFEEYHASYFNTDGEIHENLTYLKEKFERLEKTQDNWTLLKAGLPQLLASLSFDDIQFPKNQGNQSHKKMPSTISISFKRICSTEKGEDNSKYFFMSMKRICYIYMLFQVANIFFNFENQVKTKGRSIKCVIP